MQCNNDKQLHTTSLTSIIFAWSFKLTIFHLLRLSNVSCATQLFNEEWKILQLIEIAKAIN